MRIVIIVLTLCVFSIVSFAQEVTFDKKNFKDNKKEFKKAQKHLEKADKIMASQQVPNYNEALKNYLVAHAFNSKSSHVNLNIGICYLNAPQKYEALKYFEKAYELNPNLQNDVNYYLGRGYHLKMEWDKAITFYDIYKNSLDPNNSVFGIQDVNKRLLECQSGKVFVEKPLRVWIENMGSNVNSEYPDYGMIISADASEMFFTSYRPNKSGRKNEETNNIYSEDIYSSNRFKTKDWTPAENIGAPINTDGHESAIALNADGSKMIIYKDDKGDGNLYESVRQGSVWSKPKKLNDEINSKYHESSAWYSNDGKQLYFISERPLTKKGGAKDRDIYIATWLDAVGDWGNIRRLPETINTTYDEDGIFAHPNGKSIYFSSKGHNSMGGYDVFRADINEDGTWSSPENLGYPVNTPNDDVYFVVAANGRDGYMASFREGGYGDKDLYRLILLGEKKDPILSGEDILLANTTTVIRAAQVETKSNFSESKLIIIKGVIVDEETNNPIMADIELVDNNTNELISEYTSDSQSGRYLLTLPAGKDYGVTVKAEGYLFHSENFDVKTDAIYREVMVDVKMQKINVGKSIVLRNIFFDLNKFALRNESEIELNRLSQLLKDNPTLEIEISGHTDSRGADEYNKELSKNRAKAVVDYLVEKGIEKERLVFVGSGEEQPIKSDAEIARMSRLSDKEAAHQQNRRTEIKVLSK